MSESVNLPALGESVTEGTVTRWLKKIGDRVEVDEPLVEVSTDKVDTEIPSPISGVLEAILVAEDETVEVGTALATIGDGAGAGEAESPAAPVAAEAAAPTAETAEPAQPSPEPAVAEAAEAPSQFAPATVEEPAQSAEPAPAPVAEPEPAAVPAPAAEPEPEAEQQPAPVADSQAEPVAEAAPAPVQAPVESATVATEPEPFASQAGYVTPLVRKLANESGIDLSTIAGSGVGGRIRKQDVISASSGSAIQSAPAVVAPAPALVSPLRGTTAPMSRLRKVVAERAVVSMQSSAQLTTVVEVDVTAVAVLRDQVKSEFHTKTGSKLTFLPFFVLAAAEALKTFPIINATIDGENIVYPPHEHVSIAVDTERGLLTPVLRNVSDLSIAQIAKEIADLAQRTRDNKLTPDELSGGTFTVTNTGSRGALFDTPVVFLPQSAILGTGIVSKKPVVVTDNGLDAIAIRSVLYLALSYDHRIVDGADAAGFLVAVKKRLEAGNFSGDLGLS